jgi:hypothetical protein
MLYAAPCSARATSCHLSSSEEGSCKGQLGFSPHSSFGLLHGRPRRLCRRRSDLYQTFLQAKQTNTGKMLSETVMEYFEKHGEIAPPRMGRLVSIAR